MKQVLQHLRTGAVEVADVPCPTVRDGHLLIRSVRSLISSGTERMLLEFGRGNLLQKARQQPERVKQVLEKIKSDGLLPTLDAVFSKLDTPLALGYCNVGVVEEVGRGVDGFSEGDRVVSNGPHAEVVCVPRNLCARVPEGVDGDAAAFAVLGAVSLQGIRLLAPTIGESVVVIGLGLVGLIGVQILRAAGCRVLGMDIDEEKVRLAREFGVEALAVSGEDSVRACRSYTDGVGADAVLIAASTQSSDVVHHAAQMSRKRGRVVLVGVAGLELNRSDFYEKELSFQVSCSYGPGRYDPDYEDKGHDYPIGFVRWTAKRNFEAVLAMMASGRIDVKPLIDEVVPQAQAPDAYEMLLRGGSRLGTLLTYPEEAKEQSRIVRVSRDVLAAAKGAGRCVVGVIGAGNFARSTLLPALRRCDVRLKGVVSATGVSATHAAKKFGFEWAATDPEELLQDGEINTLFVVTRHNLHAAMAAAALKAGKHVYVEKPVALDPDELAAIGEAYRQSADLQLAVGFNRRFAPHTVRARTLLAARSGPLGLVAVVNAGALPEEHWLNDPQVGGGRIVGEGCHFIDLVAFLAGSPVVEVSAKALGAPDGQSMTVTLGLRDGSVGTVHYLADGNRGFPKERIDMFCDGKVLSLTNFRRMHGFGWPKSSRMRLWRQDKGHRALVRAFVDRVAQGGAPLMPFEQIENSTLASFAAVNAAASGRPVLLEGE